MNKKTVSLDESKRAYRYEFEMTTEDTCMQTWHIETVKESNAEIITNAEIAYTKQGCNGHPKTIMALIKNRSIQDIDVEALKETSCFRKQSCGMTLATCLEAIVE